MNIFLLVAKFRCLTVSDKFEIICKKGFKTEESLKAYTERFKTELIERYGFYTIDEKSLEFFIKDIEVI